MAHELLIEDGRAAMFYVGEPPWHGLGTRLDHPATAAEAIAAANLDWEVAKVPLYVAGGTRLHELPGRHATVRRDLIGSPHLRPFGIVGDQYEPLQNRDAFAFFDEIAGEAQAIYHTAGALGDGERVWILARLPESIQVAGDDHVDKFLLLSNSHDGQSAVQVKFTPIRVVCQNTLSVALERGRTYSARHDRDLRHGLRDAQAALGVIRTQFTELEGLYRRMAAIQLSTPQRTEFMADVFPDPRDPTDEAAHDRVNACRFWAAHFADHGKGNTDKKVRGTLWAAYNGVTELVDHAAGPLIGPRAAAKGKRLKLPAESSAMALRHLESSWFGRGAQTKVRAWEAAKQLVG